MNITERKQLGLKMCTKNFFFVRLAVLCCASENAAAQGYRDSIRFQGEHKRLIRCGNLRHFGGKNVDQIRVAIA